MTNLHLASYGKASAWAAQEFNVYAQRLQSLTKFSTHEFKESKIAAQNARLKEEAGWFEKRYPAGNYVRVALSEEGKLWNTVQFAGWLEQQSSKPVVFVVGSAYGIDEQLRRDSDLLWSLSPLTFTHEHARVLLVEQIYRALQYLRGHPYHHV